MPKPGSPSLLPYTERKACPATKAFVLVVLILVAGALTFIPSSLGFKFDYGQMMLAIGGFFAIVILLVVFVAAIIIDLLKSPQERMQERENYYRGQEIEIEKEKLKHERQRWLWGPLNNDDKDKD